MRQIVIVAPLLILLFFVLYMFTPGPSQKTAPERFLPTDAIIVLTQHQLEKRVQEFTESPLGRAVGSIDFQAIAEDLNLPGITGEQAISLRGELVRTFNDPLFNIIFGEEVTVALLPFTLDMSLDFKEQILAHSLIICRPKHNARLIDVIGSLVTDKKGVVESQYGGHLIRRIPLEDRQLLAAARVEDMFLFSLDERQLRRSLDRYDNADNILEHSRDYEEYRGRFKDASLFTYVNMMTFRNFLSDAIPQENGRHQTLLDELDKYDGYQYVFFGAWRHADTITEKVVIRYGKERLKETTGTYFNESRESGPTLSRTGRDSILYYWNSQFDLKPLLGYMAALEDNRQPGHLRNSDGRIAAALGLSIKQVESLTENDLTIAFKAIPSSQFVPIPFVMAALRNPDPEILQVLIHALIEHYRIPMRDVRINGVDGLSWGNLLVGGGLQPTLIFVDDYLVLSTNLSQAKEFTGMVSKENSLLTSELFKRVDKGLTEPNQSIGFFDITEITAMLKELISWGGTMVAIKDRDMARKSKILIDRLINPLLDGLSMYSVIGTRKYIEDDLIIFESTTAIEHEEK